MCASSCYIESPNPEWKIKTNTTWASNDVIYTPLNLFSDQKKKKFLLFSFLLVPVCYKYIMFLWGNLYFTSGHTHSKFVDMDWASKKGVPNELIIVNQCFDNFSFSCNNFNNFSWNGKHSEMCWKIARLYNQGMCMTWHGIYYHNKIEVIVSIHNYFFWLHLGIH